jgi:ABC-2 type transport system ATP-binding protein
MPDRILALDRLVKRYGSVPVLNGITAVVERGDVVGLLGLNGSGKTTLLETALGLAIPDEGSVTLFGQSASAMQDEKIKHRIGFVPQQDELIETLKGAQFLDLVSKFYARWNGTLIDRLAREWSVPLDKPPHKMSVGERQKLSILAALGHEPDLLVLDEPVASLDPVSRRRFLQELIDMTSGGDRTILFSTHLVGDVERIASRVWILKGGHLLVDEPLDSLKEASVAIARARNGTFPANVSIEAGMSLEEIFLELHR